MFQGIFIDREEWENFSLAYCRKHGGYLRFDENGEYTTNKDYEVVRACCFRDKHKDKPFDNWQPCNEDNCPYWGWKLRG